MAPAHRERRALFAAYWNYYRGRHRKALRVRPGQPDDNVTLNYSKRVVNKGVQFLFGKPVTFALDEQQTRNAAEQYLDTVWGTEEAKSTLLQMIAMNGGVTGTAAVRLYAPDPAVADSLPRIDNLDPSLLDIVTHEDDIDDVLSYRIVWQVKDTWKRHRIDRQMDGTWYIGAEFAKNSSDRWQEIEGESYPWPYPFAPIITAQNLPLPNELWGMSDLEEADINDSINFTASNSGRILKFHAHPRTIGTGFAASALQNTAVDDFWTIDNKDAKVYNLEMKSDLASAYNFLGLLKNAFSKITGVPELDPAQVNVGALSGFALRILYGDQLDLNQVKRNTYGGLLCEINKRVLALGGKAEYGSVTPQNIWQDPLPGSGMEEAQALDIDRRNGLSQETYLTKRGYDAAQEKQRRQAEAQERQANMGQALTDAMRQLDQGDAGMDANA